jgi:hypothetical protein
MSIQAILRQISRFVSVLRTPLNPVRERAFRVGLSNGLTISAAKVHAMAVLRNN